MLSSLLHMIATLLTATHNNSLKHVKYVTEWGEIGDKQIFLNKTKVWKLREQSCPWKNSSKANLTFIFQSLNNAS